MQTILNRSGLMRHSYRAYLVGKADFHEIEDLFITYTRGDEDMSADIQSISEELDDLTNLLMQRYLR